MMEVDTLPDSASSVCDFVLSEMMFISSDFTSLFFDEQEYNYESGDEAEDDDEEEQPYKSSAVCSYRLMS